MKNPDFGAFWLLFPVGFVALWLFVCFVISLAGWRALALHFRAESKPEGQRFPMQGAEIGGAQYNGCLSLVVAEAGLWMRPWIPFRAFHPPLLVPWSALEMPVVEKRFWSKLWLTQVQTPGKKRVKICFSPRVGELIAARVAATQPAFDASPWSEKNALD